MELKTSKRWVFSSTPPTYGRGGDSSGAKAYISQECRNGGMRPRLMVTVPDELSTNQIVDLHYQVMNPLKTQKRKYSKTVLCKNDKKVEGDKLIPQVSANVNYLVAKKFASMVPPRKDKIPLNVAKLKGRKKRHKIDYPKPLNCKARVNSNLRKISSESQNNSDERKTLEMLIPPLENYLGHNNPFSRAFQSQATCSKKSNNSKIEIISKDQNDNNIGKMFQVKCRFITENGTMKYLTDNPKVVCTTHNEKTVPEENSVNENILPDPSVTFIKTHNRLKNSSKKQFINQRGEMLKMDFLCDQCPTLLDTKDSLENHVKSHAEEMPENQLVEQFLCDQCPTLWYSIGNLKNHKNRSHSPKSAPPTQSFKEIENSGGNRRYYSCTFCQRSFYDQRGLELHKRTHMRKSCTATGNNNLPNMLQRNPDNYKKRKYKSMKSSDYYRELGCEEISEYYKKHGKTILARNSENSENKKNKTSEQDCQRLKEDKRHQMNMNDSDDDPTLLISNAMLSNDEPSVIVIDDKEEDPLMINSQPELIVIDD